jgi:hypothetical protein
MLQSSKIWLFVFLKISLGAILSIVGLLLIGILLNLVSYRTPIRPTKIIPSAERLGHEYLQAVIQKNSNYIGKDNEDNQCAHGQLLRNIAQYDGAEVRNIVASGQWESGNSDHQFEVTSIRFDYRFPRNPSWQSGEIRLMTATNLLPNASLLDALPIRRIHCAGPGV